MGIFLKNRLFVLLGLIILIYLFSYSYPSLLRVGNILVFVLLSLLIIDILFLFYVKAKIGIARIVYPKLSLGDHQKINYRIDNDSNFNLNGELVDELPYQFQHRGIIKNVSIASGRYEEIGYDITPLSRGLYSFGSAHLYLSSPYLGLAQLRHSFSIEEDVEVVPSIIQMKKYELMVFSKTARHSGIRRIRQLGENDEFEHIKAYAQGDNIKAINWKATSRNNQIMVNQFQNTKSQSVYCIVDKGRAMKMPFEGLTLLDHSINSALVIANIILKKYDRAGLITFSNKLGCLVKAESTRGQLERIIKNLYHQKTGFFESNLELLNITLRKKLSRRSILILFTNFENQYDLRRNLPYLKAINNKHLLVVIFFINTELIATSEMECKTKDEIYFKTFAQKALIDKEKIKMELNTNGIQTILTKPEDLSINVINKYLEIKAKRQL